MSRLKRLATFVIEGGLYDDAVYTEPLGGIST